jgi:hypothetical protein
VGTVLGLAVLTCVVLADAVVACAAVAVTMAPAVHDFKAVMALAVLASAVQAAVVVTYAAAVAGEVASALRNF